MMHNFTSQLRDYAEVIVHVGLNLQPGQRLLIAEPYELQGVARSAEVLVDAVKSAAMVAGSVPPAGIEVIWGDAAGLRGFAERKDWRGLAQLADANAGKMENYVRNGDALLFLLGSHPSLMDGIPSKQVAQARNLCSEHFGPVAQQLVQGGTNWTAAPAPSTEWADVVFQDRLPPERLDALWETVFAAMRIEKYNDTEKSLAERSPTSATLEAWRRHLGDLTRRRDALNAQRYKSIHFQGAGTDLTVNLPRDHLWCTACLRSKGGIDFVANLPTEEVFTLPHKDSAHGHVRIARPVTFGGAVIDGIELEFNHGQVTRASAQRGDFLLQRLLATDPGAGRLGEIALAGNFSGTEISSASTAQWAKDRLLHHVLLDENAASHIALGEGYGFCLREPNPDALNRSLIHVDLSVDATANLRR